MSSQRRKGCPYLNANEARSSLRCLRSPGAASELVAPSADAAGHQGNLLLPAVLAFLGKAADSAAAARIGSMEPLPNAAEKELFYRRLVGGNEQAWESPLVPGALMDRAVIDLRQNAPQLIEAVDEFADDQQLAVRIDAVGAAAQMGVLPPGAPLYARVTGDRPFSDLQDASETKQAPRPSRHHHEHPRLGAAVLLSVAL